jgi:hypothetical protein
MILYDLLPDPKTAGGYWTYKSGPVLAPPPPNAFNGSIDFSNAPYGTYVYTYQVQRVDCYVSSDVTIEHVEKLFVTNSTCEFAQNFTTHFINSSTQITPGTTELLDIGLFLDSCDQLNTVAPEDHPWGGDVTGDLWFATIWPQSVAGLTPINVSVNYGGGSPAFNNPLLAVYSSVGDCDGLVNIGTVQGSGLNANLTAFVPPNITNFLLIRVGTRGVNQGFFNLIIQT